MEEFWTDFASLMIITAQPSTQAPLTVFVVLKDTLRTNLKLTQFSSSQKWQNEYRKEEVVTVSKHLRLVTRVNENLGEARRGEA